MLKWFFFFFLLLFEFVADIYAKKFGMNGENKFFVLSVLFYVICNSFWLLSMKYGMLLWKGSTIFSIITILTAVFIGLFYGEKINTNQYIGLFLAMISMILIANE